MKSDMFRFEFEPSASLSDAEMTLHLALLSVEGLFGEARVRLEAGYRVDRANRQITVDGAGEVGTALIKVFTGLLNREFGESAFQVRPEGVRAETAAAHG
ncbi:MAG TPA: hypothetical protein VJZ71_17720 [Phycisphaerae bacterium]|nr:hypothetical protein [Phycisphaerae bacterium]